jgi:3-oxoacyl-[acyl-carrier-protein] synthase II
VLAALAVDRGVVPPTVNLDNPADEAAGMDLVPHTAREAKLRNVLNNSFGFGGTNATLVLRKHS